MMNTVLTFIPSLPSQPRESMQWALAGWLIRHSSEVDGIAMMRAMMWACRMRHSILPWARCKICSITLASRTGLYHRHHRTRCSTAMRRTRMSGEMGHSHIWNSRDNRRMRQGTQITTRARRQGQGDTLVCIARRIHRRRLHRHEQRRMRKRGEGESRGLLACSQATAVHRPRQAPVRLLSIFRPWTTNSIPRS